MTVQVARATDRSWEDNNIDCKQEMQDAIKHNTINVNEARTCVGHAWAPLFEMISLD